MAANLLAPSISASRDQQIDTWMPPLLRTAATTQVVDGQEAAQRSARALSLAFPQVTADFQQFWQTQTRSDYGHRAATAKVADPTAFAEMQRYLFNRYNGVSVLATLHQGPQVFDCIAQAQQPGMRDGRQAATPPQLAARGPQAAATDAQRCPQGTVPLQRIGIADLARHANLQAFLQSDSLTLAASRTSVSPAAVSDGHYYSTVYFDTGNAAVTGAGADINLWAPALRSSDEQQTISQVWIVGQSDTQQTQTLEVGWEAQPAAGWGNLPIVFIYSTQDGYAHTGCHNLDCADFVQTSNLQILGSRPSAGYSVARGKQTLMGVEFQRNTDGNWWLRIDGEWIGYYKATLYSGELGEGHAGYVTAGGEVSTRSGIPSPRMGSGQFATAGYGQAAFQANHFYRDANMTTYPVRALSNMSVVQPACYTMALVGYGYPYALGTGVTRASPAPEMRTGGFYFGGPGCPR
ncbi:DUF239 domain-containing protein [Xanthomonas vasicola]|nr:neprosin family prolyl endopeptidase [Xanthomonas vasicola]KFA30609.1 hypothetical protein KW5_0104115 [Xanthomonas vasicola pv. vasculorum NCPPB 1326]KFA36535.1 hypothetical protein KWG_0100300 [Xanthomonas vasicola pv. vasculorum NCPPB 1381]MBV6748109.1 neprosin family protein [Xanthomonas vasicola pv. vasculorum NCPPB 890]MBV6893756.1 neprosin family protein [Xanthomonas vasicola pv. vasculorum]MDO6949351.1 neprosin family prolyl endopeptidase [Xanthomonas vasicola]